MKAKSSANRRYKKQKPAQKHQNEQFFEPQVQRKCENCGDKEDKKVQKKSEQGGATPVHGVFNNYMNHIQTKGAPLPTAKKSFFEGRMQDTFGQVRLHKDNEASQAAKEIRAKAFTYQNHIVINKAYYDENSLETQQIIAHELKHVQQQRSGRHRIQLMTEEDTGQPSKEEGVTENTAAESSAMENEAEQEEALLMVPETVPDFQTFGVPVSKTVYGNGVRFEGRTDATFDGGISRTRNLRRTPAEGCSGCEAADCFHYTGQLHIQYHVATTVTLPDVPQGLTDCQHERVRNAIDNVLAPHEQEHVSAFDQYNGSVVLPIDYTGCSSGIHGYVEQLHHEHAMARMAAAQSASDALDPFHVMVDMDCEDPQADPPENTETE